MVAYSFQQQFEVPILAGTKRQTIRADRKRHARPGEEMQLYVGMRTKQCRLIAKPTCIAVKPIRIAVADAIIWIEDENALATKQSLDQFARKDGFPDWYEMQRFWRLNHPDAPIFSGVLITWRHLFRDLMESVARSRMHSV